MSDKPPFDPNAPFTTSAPDGLMSWSDVGSQAVTNLGPLGDAIQQGYRATFPSGAPVVTYEVLENSPIPLELTELGYDVRPANPAETTRILANAIVHHMTLSSSGAFEEMTPGSTTAITETRRHAGIVKTARFTFTT